VSLDTEGVEDLKDQSTFVDDLNEATIRNINKLEGILANPTRF
jgi:hypothetical protein